MIYLKAGGIPLALAYDDEIVQEANGTYQLSFKFPVVDKLWRELTPEVYLLADDLHGEEEFFVFEVVKRQGYIRVYANQVMTLLNHYAVSSISVDRQTGGRVMSALAGSLRRSSPFSFFSDVSGRHTFNVSHVSAMDALTKGKHSILGQWGGDLVRRKYRVELLQDGGAEKEALFMYKKNLKTFNEQTSVKKLVTRLHLRKKAEDGKVIVSTTVDSALIGHYRQIYEASLDVEEQSVETVADLVDYGRRYFARTLCDLVEESLTIDVEGEPDEAIGLFDVVSVFHERFGVDLRLKISKYIYTPMRGRLKQIGFGQIRSSLGQQVSALASEVADQAMSQAEADFEQRLQAELVNADRIVDGKLAELQTEIDDGIERANAKAQAYADGLKQTIESEFVTVSKQLADQATAADKAAKEALAKAGANTDLIGSLDRATKTALANLNQMTAGVTERTAKVESTLDGVTKAFTALKKTQDGFQSEFASYKQTANLYERVLGSSSQGVSGIKENIAQIAMTSQVFTTKVADATKGISTQVNQLAGSWAVKNLTSSGTVLSQLNLNKDGSVKIDGKLVQITGTTYIQDGVIGSAKIAELDGGKIKAGTVSAIKLAAEAVTADKLKVDQAFFNKLGANEAYLKQLFAKQAFISQVQAVAISANQISGGVLKALNNVTNFNLNNGLLHFNSNNTGVFRVQPGASSMGLMFQNSPVTVAGTSRVLSRAILGAERRGDNLATKWQEGGFNGLVVDTILGVETSAVETSDRVSVVGDRVRFTHTYNREGSSESQQATGWEMKTYMPMEPHPGTVVLRPTNIPQQKSIIYAGDVRLAVNATTSYSLKELLRELANAWRHYKNGGFSDGSYKAGYNQADAVYNKLK